MPGCAASRPAQGGPVPLALENKMLRGFAVIVMAQQSAQTASGFGGFDFAGYRDRHPHYAAVGVGPVDERQRQQGDVRPFAGAAFRGMPANPFRYGFRALAHYQVAEGVSELAGGAQIQPLAGGLEHDQLVIEPGLRTFRLGGFADGGVSLPTAGFRPPAPGVGGDEIVQPAGVGDTHRHAAGFSQRNPAGRRRVFLHPSLRQRTGMPDIGDFGANILERRPILPRLRVPPD